MMLTKEHSTPDFSTPVEIEPAKLNDFCRRFELARVNLSEIEPISQQESSGHKLVGIRIGCDAFHASPRFIKSLMLLFGFTDNIFNYFSPAELFARIIDRHQDKAVQLCFDQKDKAVMAAT